MTAIPRVLCSPIFSLIFLASVGINFASAESVPKSDKEHVRFIPLETLPAGEIAEMIKFGEDVFVNTPTAAKDYVGNGLTCANCHLDRGRLADASPMWAAFGVFPQYRKKNKKVITLEDRLRDCFRYSMNGKMPEYGSPQLVGLVSYVKWLSTDVPVGRLMEGRGYPVLPKPALSPSRERGQLVFSGQCVICHGEAGQGKKVGDRYAFPPLWGADSYNWGAGMHRLPLAAGFIKANMPFGRGGSLSIQEAWDVAAFVNSHPRPQDPRFTGNVEETRKQFHDDDDYYGQVVDNAVLGAPLVKCSQKGAQKGSKNSDKKAAEPCRSR